MRFDPDSKPLNPGWRRKLYEIIFETDSRPGQRFDVALLVCVAANVICISLETVSSVASRHGELLHAMEWGFTALFSVEYLLRLMCTQRPTRYAFSVLGLIDLISIAPTFLGFFVGATTAAPLMVLRALRLLRIFRVLHLGAFVREGDTLWRALRASTHKIIVFTVVILVVALVQGTLLYFVEGGQPDSDFTSIPQSVYWAIVTMTTVGYGDMAPHSPLGQALAALLMVVGYGIIAVPTGIVTAEFIRENQGGSARRVVDSKQYCSSCGASDDASAKYCRECGVSMR